MDPPESTPERRQLPAPAAAPYEDSPIFDFISTLSPIETLKPPSLVQPVQLFKPSELSPVSSIYNSLHINPDKKSQHITRDGTVQLSQGGPVDCQMSQIGTSSCIQISGSTKSASERVDMNCSVNKALLNDHYVDTLRVPRDNMLMDNALSQHQYGMHRRSLFDENVGPSGMRVESVLNLYPAISCTDNYLKLAGSPVCALPGIDLHLNAVASISKEVMPYYNQSSGDLYSITPFAINPSLLPEQNGPMESVISGNDLVPCSSDVGTCIQSDHSSQKTTPSANESGKESHKKRRKFQNGDGDSCRQCSCKRSKCLKLYCACFAAKVYCSGACSCQGCLNNHAHKEIVLCTHKKIESRNPLAFAPNIIGTCGSSQEFGDNPNKTPASARHKRGCNCRKSFCVKKYCECFQSGVGCSIICRCESCNNSFGRREGVLSLNRKAAFEKEEELHFDKQPLFEQSFDLPSSENLLRTPTSGPCRSSVLLPSTCSKPPISSTGCSSPQHNSQSPIETDASLSYPKTHSAEMILGNGPSNCQEEDSSCAAGVKVVSPNKKRVSPRQIGIGPTNRSGRELILEFTPLFPSLSGDVNSEPH